MSRMKAPESGVKVRMYRQGQGDCFLLAFPRKGAGPDNPVYILIDCGYMYGSQFDGISLDEIVAHIAEATGGFIDFVAITHEHADHVNGFMVNKNNENRFTGKIEFGSLWLAWTEDGDDDLANQLRERHKDQLVALSLAEARMTAMGMDDDSLNLSQFLELELGPEAERQAIAKSLMAATGPKKISGISNKLAIKYLRDTAQNGPSFLNPGQAAFSVEGSTGAQVYVLGPPRNETLLLSLNPEGTEEFHLGDAMAPSGEAAAFQMALTAEAGTGGASPFALRYMRSEAEVSTEAEGYYARVYYEAGKAEKTGENRRIDGDWLRTAGRFALRLNDEVNNSSLVLAFSLPQTGKVLLFSGDAQRGNWISWSDISWESDAGVLTTKELLGRCVFYKCGHHGSHNATLKGTTAHPYANLGWLAQNEFANEFVAMIPVHSEWARTKKHWNHPLPSIEEALMQKARGRVLRNDLDRVKRPKPKDGHGTLSDTEWRAFKELSIEARLYKEYIVMDE